MRHLGWIALLLFVGCDSGSNVRSCTSSTECGAGETCVDSRCVARSDSGAALDAGPPDAGTCPPGQVRSGASCGDDCGDPRATPCGSGQTCDFATGACAPEDRAGILTGPDVTCGERTCRAGTECSIDLECEPIPACSRRSCTPDLATCWGGSCVTTRPPPRCMPATLERMNEADFLLGGDGGAFDLELDDACNAYAVTMISGTDYLRQLAPDGTLTVWSGVTNLNMGEVAVRRELGGEFGGAEGPGEVGLTYVCCASCGCVGSDPQGVARLDRMGMASLPMVIEAMPSTGTGPWSSAALDTGPYGLAWGRDRTLYVGNVLTNGDLVRASLETGTTEEIHRFDARVLATATWGARSLAVALDGGRIVIASVDSDRTRVLTDAGEDVTSLVRDPLTGDAYVALASGVIARFDAEGTRLADLVESGPPVRIAYAPDGYLYALDPGWPRPGAITRHALPATR